AAPIGVAAQRRRHLVVAVGNHAVGRNHRVSDDLKAQDKSSGGRYKGPPVFRTSELRSIVLRIATKTSLVPSIVRPSLPHTIKREAHRAEDFEGGACRRSAQPVRRSLPDSGLCPGYGRLQGRPQRRRLREL